MFYSCDRGRSWDGPFRLPSFDTPGIAPRTDYIVDGQATCTLFITAAKPNGREGRPLCVRTTDGGKTWKFLSWIAPEPEEGFSIMPASLRLSETDILVTVRDREGPRRWIATYLSTDNGATWEYINDAVSDTGVGNPPAMIRLRDGRICLLYGYRAEPYSIRAVLSGDGGRTWSDPVTLRDDGASRDIGYVRAVRETGRQGGRRLLLHRRGLRPRALHRSDDLEPAVGIACGRGLSLAIENVRLRALSREGSGAAEARQTASACRIITAERVHHGGYLMPMI